MNKALGNKKGSVILLALIMTTAIGLVIASLLNYGGTETRLNEGNISSIEARNAAESMLEYGFSDLQKRVKNQTAFTIDQLRTNPLKIPSTAESFYAGTDVVFDELELIGGDVDPVATARYIDPSDPGNTMDPQKGKLVFQREVVVYGKGVSKHTFLGRQQAFARQTMAVRDAPLFSHAVFYNMDLEFHPGPSMDMHGPVHSNSDIYVQAVNKLSFYSTLMAYGDVYHGSKASGNHSQKGTVRIKDLNGSWQSMYIGGSKTADSSYVDSRLGADWRAAASNRWGGNVGSGDHRVPKLNPVGIDDYIPDDPSTPAYDVYNPAYALIEPQVSDSHANYKGDAVRAEQFSYKAGMIFRVTEVSDSTKPRGVGYQLNAYTYNRAKQTDPKSEPILDNSGKPQEIDLDLTNAHLKLGKNIISVNYYEEDSSGTPIGGFYDMRQKVGLDVIELDVGVLREVIDDGDIVTPSNDPWDGKFHMKPGTALDWNGVVYVELPFDDTAVSDPDKVMPAKREVALRLFNAKDVPNPDYMKQTGYDPGFTLATNGMLYIKGHYNSDGNSSTGSSTKTDDGLTNTTSSEATTALVADSITILSSNFNDAKSKLPHSKRKATFTEVSAGFLTGIVPTVPGMQSSGGAHNFPRFLENWSNKEFRYRGSLVSMFESEIATAPIDGFNHKNTGWYSPPKRNWGFSDFFKYGLYPPGTPLTRDLRLTRFEYLTEVEYENSLKTLTGFNPNSSSRGH